MTAIQARQTVASARAPARDSASTDPTVPSDVLVFERSTIGFSLVGGSGRGAGWAGLVDLGRERSLVSRAWDSGAPVRQSGQRASQVAGPYHAKHAVAVAVGDRHVVVLGGNTPLELLDADVIRLAAAAVNRVGGIPAEKVLADELELVHALKALMAYRPETVRDTLQHIASVAASALSCEVACVALGAASAVRVSIGFDPAAETGQSAIDRHLAAAIERGSQIVDQASREGPTLFGIEVASTMTLPIGADPAIGALALAHSADRPRGFTSLCQRIGRAVAESAELLISQANAREQLAAERDSLAAASGTDSLTGVRNRRSWGQAVSDLCVAAERSLGFVLTCDLDGLKLANDRYGHAAGDALIRATAELLTSCVREEDFVARVGGDEFAVLLRHADEQAARRVRDRIRRKERAWRTVEHGLTPRLSIGLARISGVDVEGARREADHRMYANKRRRARRAKAN